MRIGIICAMREELEPLLAELTNKSEKTAGGRTFHFGTLEGKDVILTISGIGKVESALTTATMISLYNPDYVINTGSAGCLLSTDIAAIGDVILSEKVAFHDFDLTAFGYKIGQVPQHEQFVSANEKLLNIGKSCKELKVHTGLIVSGDQFICSEQQRNLIKNNFPNVAACEMEGASIGYVCNEFKVPFLVIRSVSDIANAESTITFDEFLPTAAKNAATMTKHILANL